MTPGAPGPLRQGRPQAVTQAIAAEIVRLAGMPGANPNSIHRHLAAAGYHLSVRTVYRYLEKLRGSGDEPRPNATVWLPPGLAATPQSGPIGNPAESGSSGFAGGDDCSPAAIEADMRQRYRGAKSVADSLQPLARVGGPEARRFFEATRLVKDLAVGLSELAPPYIPDPEQDPGYLKAKEALLRRAREIVGG